MSKVREEIGQCSKQRKGGVFVMAKTVGGKLLLNQHLEGVH